MVRRLTCERTMLNFPSIVFPLGQLAHVGASCYSSTPRAPRARVSGSLQGIFMKAAMHQPISSPTLRRLRELLDVSRKLIAESQGLIAESQRIQRNAENVAEECRAFRRIEKRPSDDHGG
jgi:hypothetical protein